VFNALRLRRFRSERTRDPAAAAATASIDARHEVAA
jgi:hypothetical protein